jgi:hypothetical protein
MKQCLIKYKGNVIFTFHFNIILPIFSSRCFLLSGFPTKTLYAFLVFALCAAFSAQFFDFYQTILIAIADRAVTKLTIYPPSSCHAYLLSPNTLLTQVFSNSLNLPPSLGVTEKKISEPKLSGTTNVAVTPEVRTELKITEFR